MNTTTKILVGLGCVAIAGAGVVGYSYLSHSPRVVAGTQFEEIDLSGKTSEEVEFELNQWWERYRNEPVSLSSQILNNSIMRLTLGELGIEFDRDKTKASIPFDSPLDRVTAGFRNGQQVTIVKPVFLFAELSNSAREKLSQFVSSNAPNKRDARAYFRRGSIVTVSEIPSKKPDFEQLGLRLAEAAKKRNWSVEIPLATGNQRVPDSELNRINYVLSEFSTKFAASNAPRVNNIRIASEKLNGLIIMPGERVSFNEVVGRRTREAGFQMAGAFINGRLDEDIGGGICQVSSTLYNAVLLADMKIVRRQNHSMPVPYLPIGRDAAVAYPSIDLVFENNQSYPMALTASVVGDTLTFRVLGPAEAKRDIEIVAGPSRSWPTGTEYIEDPSLGYGVTRVRQKATGGHSITMYRVVRKNGEEIRRESLGQSYYRGGKQIIARNSRATPPVATSTEGQKAEPTTPAATPATNDGAAPSATATTSSATTSPTG
jgi:vancomycin resistance protein YoaR